MKADLYAFDVGHGSSSLLCIKRSNDEPYCVLVDGGYRKYTPLDQLEPILKKAGKTSLTIDLVVLTHIHQDHCEGLVKIFEEWRETRNEAVLKVEHSGEPVLNQRIDEMSEEDLDFFFARVVAEFEERRWTRRTWQDHL